MARVAGIAWVSDIAEVPQMLVDDHVPMKLAHVLARESVRMRAVKLSDRIAVEGVNVAPPPEADRFASCTVQVIHRTFLSISTHSSLLFQLETDWGRRGMDAVTNVDHYLHK
jgi:hypothetical protein